MEEFVIFQITSNIKNHFQILNTNIEVNRLLCFEKEKFRHKGDVSMLKRHLYLEKENANSLLLKSQDWNIPLKQCKFSSDYLHIFLNREIVFRETINQVNNLKLSYGFQKNNRKLNLQKDKSNKNDLTQLRIDLAFEFLSNLAKKSENEIYSTFDEEDIIHNGEKLNQLYFTNKNEVPDGFQRVFVMGVEDGKKKSELSRDEYWSLKASEISSMSNGMESIKSNGDLVDTCVKFDLFHGSLSSPARISQNVEISHNTKDAIFVVYNYVRLKSILNTFESKVDQKVYPCLPKIEDIDFSLLSKEEEWSILLDFIVRFPLLISEFSSNINEGKFHLHKFFIILVAFSNQLSRYYRRIRILIEPKPHLINVMFSRIHLISACIVIYDILFQCFNIKPPLSM